MVGQAIPLPSACAGLNVAKAGKELSAAQGSGKGFRKGADAMIEQGGKD